MKFFYAIPSSITEAEDQLSVGHTINLMELPKEDFLAKWFALAYLEPGLHPEGYESEDSGWPADLLPYAAEAWRRYKCGTINENEMYCYYAAWAGLYDQMHSHTEEETVRRKNIAGGNF